ncbi:uncharacterized protein [Haliotis cracherodii]|uniref:uncharacterized protein n=1 Tax=Haliotis cracherodii TaxID=6455 RepID=UPI0039EAF04C
MAEKGFEKTPDQCKVRIHTLKRSFRECKTSMKKSGKDRKTCKFFEELDVILGNRPASSPPKVIDTLTKKAGLEEADKSDYDDNDYGDIPQSVNDDLSDITPPEREDGHRKEKESSDIKDKNDEGLGEKRKKEESADKVKSEKKRMRKTRLEVALKSVMDGFNAANEKAEDKVVYIERRKLDLEKQKLDLEKAKLESEERQKREEREHQLNMMKMIMGAIGQRQAGQPHSMPSFPVSMSPMHSGEGQVYRGHSRIQVMTMQQPITVQANSTSMSNRFCKHLQRSFKRPREFSIVILALLRR